MKMKISEVMDRYTILKMKARFDPDLEDECNFHLMEIMGEIREVLKSERFGDMSTNRDKLIPFIKSLVTLAEANARIWENEAGIRKETENDPLAKEKLSLEEIGRRALIVRGHNALRTDAKNVVNELFMDGQDKKFDHVSEQ